MAFRKCRRLNDVRLNEDIRELGWLCFWETGVTDLKLPPQIKMTPEQLGIGQADQLVLRLPDGLDRVGDGWFAGSDIEKLVIPSCVRALGNSAFANCEQLREVVFEQNSQLEHIGEKCFENCGLKEILIPRSVRNIG